MADFQEKWNEINDTVDYTDTLNERDIQQNKGMAVLAYISWLVLIPLFAAKDSRFARFHCNQGLVLAIVEIVAWVVFGILSRLPLIGWIFSILSALVSLVCLILAILGIVNAVNGRAKELPLVGKYTVLR